MARYVATLDLGSSGLRAHVVSTDTWAIVAGASRRYRVVRSPDGLAQRFTPNDLRRRIVDVLAEAVSASGARPDDVDTLAITAQRGGTAFLDQLGNTLYVGPNSDIRAVFEGGAIDDAHADEVYATTGHLPSMFFVPAKLHWWRQHHPRIARRTANIASLGAWVAYQLTGELAETPATLTELGLADVSTGLPAPRLLDQLNVSLDLLPRTTPAGESIGELSAVIASLVGLADGTRVCLAGPDAQIATLATGSTEPGDTTIVAGWSAPVQRVTATPPFDGQRRTWAGRHIVDDRWLAEANPGDTGATLDMVRGMLAGHVSPQRFSELAATAPTDAIPAFAFWGPRALDLSNPGMSIGGLLTPSPITHEGLTAPAVARATFENIAFAIRECVAMLDEVTGAATSPIALTGGMSTSGFFAQMLATTLAKPVWRHDARSAALGAAIVSSAPAAEWQATAKRLAERAELIEPATSDVMEAADRYSRWLALRERLDAMASEF